MDELSVAIVIGNASAAFCPDGGAVAFGVYFDLRAADRDEFGVEGDNGPFDWSFLRECERSICFHWVGTVAV